MSWDGAMEALYEAWMESQANAVCSCTPCESPSYGAPGIAHCAACCAGSMIEAYDHDCPVLEHQDLAVAQWGSR